MAIVTRSTTVASLLCSHHNLHSHSPQSPSFFNNRDVSAAFASRGSIRVSAERTRRREMVLEQQVKEKEEEEGFLLKMGIAEFYDQSSGIWEDIWGDHMHHGFYAQDSTVSVSGHRAAQIRMIEESLRFAGVTASGATSYLSS